MDVHKAIADLTKHAIFKEWRKSNEDYFLAHAFVMLDEPNKNTWQIGFYNPDKEKMTTFMLTGPNIQKTEDQEVLRTEGKIQPLKPEEITHTIEDALKTAKTILNEYKETPIKEFFIIQHAEGHTIFNITYFTQTLKTINVKIDTKTGKIIKHDIQNLAEFG